MKTLKFIPLIISMLILISCEKNEELKPSPVELKPFPVEYGPPSVEYQKTIFGGCNVIINPDYRHNDTVAISIIDDTIHVFVGHNHICGAPFKTKCEMMNDTVFMYIIDTCPDSRCYYRCTCYYTFDFVFIKQEERNQNYKIILIDPRTKDPIIIEENNFQNKILI